ncbi:MAG: hypothetical protein DRP56_06645 [Planctomycetota bacterium]|nr:MAG: hypothetical protein DRP56_06645 [Planctomycetota bacterium]
MKFKPVKSVKFSEQAYPDVIEAVNCLAQLEDRKPHDTAKRVLLDGCKQRIREVESNNQSASAG